MLFGTAIINDLPDQKTENLGFSGASLMPLNATVAK
jgi:hypothetical protein